MKKIVTIIGARPQFIKAAVVSRIIHKTPGVEEKIIHTGQHFDVNMSNVFFEEMKIPSPDYFLNINGLNHGAMTGQMLEKIEEVLTQERPDWVLVYGDTNSTLAGALAAAKMHIKVAHVEAGLRSFNMSMPEEINRILTDRVSNLLFCPTQVAVNNLKTEGYHQFGCEIVETGDVMYDAAMFYAENARKPAVDLPDSFILCTLHRPQNTDNQNNIKSIFSALETISKRTKVVIPIHPRTEKKLIEAGYNFSSSNILFIAPVGYLEMIWLLSNCELVMTDSGGLQKEAFFFKKYCITLREETEWIELVENEVNVLAGSCSAKILQAYEKSYVCNQNSFLLPLYGNQNAGEMIIQKLL
jgi:UDP-GlcNAc3NAcA epimerase